jgi:hypothetical protein
MKIQWPDGKSFAFTVFDDPDRDVMNNTKPVYDFLRDLGFRTTKGVWMLDAEDHCGPTGLSCENRQYLDWILDLKASGFEIGYHNARSHDSKRDLTLKALDLFKQHFGRNPACMSNHYTNREAIYWGPNRLTGPYRAIYRLAKRGNIEYEGHLEDSDFFWGDLCKERVRYVRNFVYPDINTLKACPFMPYHDETMPYVQYWYASCEGGTVEDYVRSLSEKRQDRLIEEGGACIMYSHYAKGFFRDGHLDRRFRELMERLASLNGWFVPVWELLGYLREQGAGKIVASGQRNRLQQKWLVYKMLKSSS